jgi:hypothetical protein
MEVTGPTSTDTSEAAVLSDRSASPTKGHVPRREGVWTAKTPPPRQANSANIIYAEGLAGIGAPAMPAGGKEIWLLYRTQD